ncbi:MAG: HD domain-containing protein [Ruminococcaceae bacterium]|nr:HD domain-containing protein [Oscillospiraceae bacterium]
MNSTLGTGGSNDGFWLIKTADKKVNVKGAAYLDLVLCDKKGEISGKLWDYNEFSHGIYQAGDLVKIRGTVTQFNGNDQLRIDRIRKVTEADGVNIADFVPTAEYSGEMMLGQIMNIIASVKDEELKHLTFALVKDREEKILYWPAAFKLHHAIRGGLLYHTLSILKLCESVCSIYPAVDRDLLMCGAIVHDLCKIDEFEISSAGLVTGYSVKGELLGHLVMGAVKIEEKARQLGIDSEKAMLLQHMVISHHGEPDFGAAVRPMFLEAEILSELDKLDATVNEITSATADLNEGEFSQRMWALDNRKLYNHGRKEVTVKANLE